VAVVGTLEWQNQEMFDSFPKEKRRDAALVRFFQQAGVPAGQIAYLCDRQARYAQIARTLPAHFAQAQPGDFLFVYYCGHGYKLDSGEACMACYDAGAEGCPDWSMASLPALIEQHFPGDHALIAADCCYSGCLAGAVTAHRGRVSYACLTSSLASESSTGNWTFTEGLLKVHCYGWEATDDEWVMPDRMRQVTPVEYPAGTAVEVKWKRRWYPAFVQAVQSGIHYIQYDGYDAAWNEWVAGKRIRLPPE
jgi:hypothetical protein